MYSTSSRDKPFSTTPGRDTQRHAHGSGPELPGLGGLLAGGAVRRSLAIGGVA